MPEKDKKIYIVNQCLKKSDITSECQLLMCVLSHLLESSTLTNGLLIRPPATNDTYGQIKMSIYILIINNYGQHICMEKMTNSLITTKAQISSEEMKYYLCIYEGLFFLLAQH